MKKKEGNPKRKHPRSSKIQDRVGCTLGEAILVVRELPQHDKKFVIFSLKFSFAAL
jgi:hypothetical protein